MTTSRQANGITAWTQARCPVARHTTARAATMRRTTTPRPLAAFGALAVAVVLVASAPARGASFLDEVDRGKAAVAASGAATMNGAAARAAAVNDVVAKDAKGSPAFTIGATLAALDLDLESEPSTGKRGDRAVVEQQVRDLLAAQAESRIGNRALCLLSGRSNPRSLEAQVRLVEPTWSCGHMH